MINTLREDMDIAYIVGLFNKIVHASELKWASAGLLSIASFFFDPAEHIAIIAVFFLVIGDFVFGYAAAKSEGEPIRSAKLRRTAIKLVVYFSLISLARITEYAVPIPIMDETVTGFLAATELLSILENAGRMGYAVPMKLTAFLNDYIGVKKDERSTKDKK